MMRHALRCLCLDDSLVLFDFMDRYQDAHCFDHCAVKTTSEPCLPYDDGSRFEV